MNINNPTHTRQLKEPLECALRDLQERIAKIDMPIEPNITIHISLDRITQELCGDAVIQMCVVTGGWKVR